MKLRFCALFIVILSCRAEDVTFRTAKLCSPSDDKETQIDLTLKDHSFLIEGKSPAVRSDIDYSSVGSITYERGHHHRILEGAGVAAASLGVGLIVAATTAKEHWLTIEYTGPAGAKNNLLLRLDKHDYRKIISAFEDHTHSAIAGVNSTRALDPTVGSKDVDETVAFLPEKVHAAIRDAMLSASCRIQKEDSLSLTCKRRKGNVDISGSGGEIITAKIQPRPSGSHVHIATEKVALSSRNWSTPIFEDMKHHLESPK